MHEALFLMLGLLEVRQRYMVGATGGQGAVRGLWEDKGAADVSE